MENKHVVKVANLDKVRSILFKYGSATKAKLASESDISTVTVNGLVKELVEAGEFIGGELIHPKIGRPSVHYHFNYNFEHYMLISIQETAGKLHIVARVVNMRGDVKLRKGYPMEEVEVGVVVDAVKEILAEKIAITSIAISIPGKTIGSKIAVSWRNALNGWDLETEIGSRFGIPVYVENDANLATIGYCKAVKIPETDYVVGIYYLPMSMPGASLFHNNRLFRGQDGLAGEARYLPQLIGRECASSFDESVQNLLEIIGIYNSLLAPHTFVIHMAGLSQAELAARISEDRILQEQPNKARFFCADSFDEDVMAGLQWLAMSDVAYLTLK
ncbi:ROK family protein [Paenilisteria rocourtiae]|uniref:ROK family protein n=1 Tax=Listeria rocourtiae TaxID=647910 RepID=UPI0003E8AEA6|nr:ROK family protein [Listeria rocourtiae]EUJ52282.1 ROK family protein [Listeria rocourtiae FSL F6-920]MBC1605753.1 ROK family protein [Listeria rocourtiae]